jgi:hypothetical protein
MWSFQLCLTIGHSPALKNKTARMQAARSVEKSSPFEGRPQGRTSLMILAKQRAASGLVLQRLDFFRLFFIKEKGPPS